jgi:hypothetical protein
MSPDLLSEHLVDVLDRLSGQEAVRFRGFVARAELDRPVMVEASEAAAAVRPYAWLLDRLGADGVRLTSAGHLPPAVVTEAMDALGDRERWFGAANREYHTRPVLELRESARRFGLVRKHRGVLLSTRVGSSLSATRSGCGGTSRTAFLTLARKPPRTPGCCSWSPPPQVRRSIRRGFTGC